MKIEEYRRLDKKELKSKIVDLTMSLMQTYRVKGHPQHRPNLKKEIAKIKTVLNDRQKDTRKKE